jgi:hypothetical protein
MSPKIKLSIVALALAACAATSMSAFAEDKPARVRGTLQKMDGNTLTIETKSGKETNVPLKDGAPVIGVTKGAMSDIKDNTFVVSRPCRNLTARKRQSKFTCSRSRYAGSVKDIIRGT